MAQVVDQTALQPDDTALDQSIRHMLLAEVLRHDCEAILAYRDNNYFPLMYRFFTSHHPRYSRNLQ